MDDFAKSFCMSHVKSHSVMLIFDTFMAGSIKSHELKRCASDKVPQQYNLEKSTKLPHQDEIMKTDHNKLKLINVLCSTPLKAPLRHLVAEQQNPFKHEEADVSIISFMLQLYEQHSHIQVTADDADFPVTCFYVWKFKIVVTMKKHDGQIININETVSKLGNKCKDLLPLHAMT